MRLEVKALEVSRAAACSGYEAAVLKAALG